LEEDCFGSRGPKRTVALEEEEKKKKEEEQEEENDLLGAR
jgi:hypothetical protein